MATSLFVGGIPFSATSEDLHENISQQLVTVASAKVITDRETGRSRGFGFVEFENDERCTESYRNVQQPRYGWKNNSRE